jgi:hypothetical protein
MRSSRRCLSIDEQSAASARVGGDNRHARDEENVHVAQPTARASSRFARFPTILAGEWSAEAALGREWAPVVDARWTSNQAIRAHSPSDRGLQRRKREIADLTTE